MCSGLFKEQPLDRLPPSRKQTWGNAWIANWQPQGLTLEVIFLPANHFKTDLGIKAFFFFLPKFNHASSSSPVHILYWQLLNLIHSLLIQTLQAWVCNLWDKAFCLPNFQNESYYAKENLAYNHLSNSKRAHIWSFSFICLLSMASHVSLVVKNPPANAGDIRKASSVLGLGEGNGNPVQYSCLGNPMDRGAWQATVHEVAKSWTWLSN